VSGAVISGGSGTPDLAGSRALIAGGLGFLGLNLVGPLLDAGAEVRVLSRSLHPLALAWLDEICGGRAVEVVQRDLGDAERHPEWFDGFDLIFQLAGESGAAQSVREARADMQANVAGHLALLEAIRSLASPPRVVFASSRLVYGSTGSEPVSEEHPTRPTSLYGVHKLTVEHYHRLYWMHYGVPFCALRITNPYGPYQLPGRRHYGILNHFAMTALAGETISLYGGGGQLRDYIHVADVARALLLAATAERASGEIFNLGAGRSVTLQGAASRLVALAGAGRLEEVAWPEGALRVETGDFVCDVARIAERLGWRAEIDLDSGLGATLDAYRRLLP
jgi:nucleoside-diphosphate-sugar epimerase